MKVNDKSSKPVKAGSVMFGRVVRYEHGNWILSKGLEAGSVLLVNLEDGAQLSLGNDAQVLVLTAEVTLS